MYPIIKVITLTFSFLIINNLFGAQIDHTEQKYEIIMTTVGFKIHEGSRKNVVFREDKEKSFRNIDAYVQQIAFCKRSQKFSICAEKPVLEFQKGFTVNGNEVNGMELTTYYFEEEKKLGLSHAPHFIPYIKYIPVIYTDTKLISEIAPDKMLVIFDAMGTDTTDLKIESIEIIQLYSPTGYFRNWALSVNTNKFGKVVIELEDNTPLRENLPIGNRTIELKNHDKYTHVHVREMSDNDYYGRDYLKLDLDQVSKYKDFNFEEVRQLLDQQYETNF